MMAIYADHSRCPLSSSVPISLSPQTAHVWRAPLGVRCFRLVRLMPYAHANERALGIETRRRAAVRLQHHRIACKVRPNLVPRNDLGYGSRPSNHSHRLLRLSSLRMRTSRLPQPRRHAAAGCHSRPSSAIPNLPPLPMRVQEASATAGPILRPEEGLPNLLA